VADRLIERIKGAEEHSKWICYADDMVGVDVNQLENIEKRAEEVGLKLNASKCVSFKKKFSRIPCRRTA
jgi:hypothetical protein